MMTADDFTEAANAAGREYASTPRMNVGTVQDRIGQAHADGWEAARTHLATQEPTDAARIIDEHRTTGRWVGDGVRVECTCGHISPGSHPGGPQTDEDNAHRDADRKHAAHVADMLARAARRDEETP